MSNGEAMPANTTETEKRLWDAADTLRANSHLKAHEYAVPVLGLIFLKYADQKFAQVGATLGPGTARRPTGKVDYQAANALYLPPSARFGYLVDLPEGEDTGKAINDAMRAIESENPYLTDVLPKSYNRIDNAILIDLLRNFNRITLNRDMEGDAFGKIYEYFLGKFAMAEGQGGGEFFTPTSIVKLIVEIVEPYRGRILDPACGSGGMFVQSAAFVERHRRNPNSDIFVEGQEKTLETVRLAQMNLAVHGLSGDIKQGNSYYEDNFALRGRYDAVMANPPFNVDGVDKERLAGDPRFPFGLPRAANANYLWIQLFWSALNATGRAGFVMANSAGDARGSEQEIRQKLVEAGAVDVMVAVGPNFFYTVTLPCTLWFFDRGRAQTPRRDQTLFLDARHLFRQVDRAHREWTDAQITFLANIVRLYRGVPVEAAPEGEAGGEAGDLLAAHFPGGTYADVAGLCKVATTAEIAAQGWSLNPGRYVGVTAKAADEFVFAERLGAWNEELETLNGQARELEERIAGNIARLLEVVG